MAEPKTPKLIADKDVMQSNIDSDTCWDTVSEPIHPDETVHYLSPASTDRTELEGDINYRDYLELPLVVQDKDFYSVSGSFIACPDPQFQRTLAIIKPDAIIYKDVVLRAIMESGLNILSTRTVHLTPEQVSELYYRHYGDSSFPLMVVSMSSAPVLVLSLSGINAVRRWNNMIGPDKVLPQEWFFPSSIKHRFGLHGDIPDALHGSENLHESNLENRYFFPKSVLEPILHEKDEVADFCKLYVNPTLLCGLTEVARNKPLDPILFLAEWLLTHNPFRPKLPVKSSLAQT